MVPTCCTYATGWPVEQPSSGYPSFNSFKHMAVQEDLSSEFSRSI
jgi:hypothetical protein